MKAVFTSLYLVLLTTFAMSSSVVIFRENTSTDRQIESIIREHSPESIAFRREASISSQGQLRQVLDRNPDFLIFIDPISAATYHRYVQYNSTRAVPSVIIAEDSDKYGSYSSLTGATVYGIDPSINDIKSRISGLVSGIERVGALYTSSTKSRVEAKIEQHGRSRVVTSPLLGALSSQSVINGLENISDRKTVALWVAGRELNSFMSRNEDVKEVISERIGAIITEERVVAEAIRAEVPVLYLHPDVNTIAKYIAARITMFSTDPSTAGSGDRKFCGYSMRYCNGETSRTFSSPQRSSATNLLTRASTNYKTMLENKNPTETAVAEATVPTTPAEVTVVTEAVPTVDSLSSNENTASVSSTTDNVATSQVVIEEEFEAVAVAVQTSSAASEQTPSRRVVVNVVENPSPPAQPTSLVTITTSIANIFSVITPEPLLLAVAKAGDEFILVDSIGDYLKINAWGKTGFIHRTEVIEVVPIIVPEPVITLPEETFFETYLLYALLASLITFILISLIIIVRYKRVKNRRHRYRAALIVARKPSKVKIIDGNKKMSLKKHLYKSGTLLSSVRSPNKLRKRMINHMPDIILVDWEVDQWIIDVVQKQLQKYRLSSATTVLFYNVADDEQAHFSGDFGDAEIHVCEGALGKDAISSIFSGQSEAPVRESASLDTSSYLAGMVQGNALQDILQLIETGRKNGCLVIEDDSPHAAIFFKDGIIVYAVTRDDVKGVEAIYKSLDMTSGSFYFILDKAPHEETVSLSVMAVLMEWSAIEDRKTMQINAIKHS